MTDETNAPELDTTALAAALKERYSPEAIQALVYRDPYRGLLINVVECNWCDGTGYVVTDQHDTLCHWQGTEECIGCNGTGYVYTKSKEDPK